jgi:hypothetical protein
MDLYSRLFLKRNDCMADASRISCKEGLDPTINGTFSEILLKKTENISLANKITIVIPLFNQLNDCIFLIRRQYQRTMRWFGLCFGRGADFLHVECFNCTDTHDHGARESSATFYLCKIAGENKLLIARF